MDGTNSNIYPICQNNLPGRVDKNTTRKPYPVYFFKTFQRKQLILLHNDYFNTEAHTDRLTGKPRVFRRLGWFLGWVWSDRLKALPGMRFINNSMLHLATAYLTVPTSYCKSCDQRQLANLYSSGKLGFYHQQYIFQPGKTGKNNRNFEIDRDKSFHGYEVFNKGHRESRFGI